MGFECLNHWQNNSRLDSRLQFDWKKLTIEPLRHCWLDVRMHVLLCGWALRCHRFGRGGPIQHGDCGRDGHWLQQSYQQRILVRTCHVLLRDRCPHRRYRHRLHLQQRSSRETCLSSPLRSKGVPCSREAAEGGLMRASWDRQSIRGGIIHCCIRLPRKWGTSSGESQQCLRGYSIRSPPFIFCRCDGRCYRRVRAGRGLMGYASITNWGVHNIRPIKRNTLQK